MPPRKKVIKKASEPTLFDQLGATMPVETPTTATAGDPSEPPPTEHVLLKLPIPDTRIDELLHTEEMQMVLEYNPRISEPVPYGADNTSGFEYIGPESPPQAPVALEGDLGAHATQKEEIIEPSKEACFWCCHPIEHRTYGMPIRFDAYSKAFTLYGSFCSLQCASAHNFLVNPGSDRAWEIQSWIQMLGHRYGFQETIRPAPSRYLLKMFGGSMTIEEFRACHRTTSKTYTLNIPPIISVAAQSECINTSYIGKST